MGPALYRAEGLAFLAAAAGSELALNTQNFTWASARLPAASSARIAMVYVPGRNRSVVSTLRGRNASRLVVASEREPKTAVTSPAGVGSSRARTVRERSGCRATGRGLSDRCCGHLLCGREFNRLRSA